MRLWYSISSLTGGVVHVVAETLFSLHLVAVGHGNVVHLVAEAEDEAVLSISPSYSHALPYGDFLLSLRVAPVSYDNFAADAHAGADMTELTVAVCTLVEVHEVHIHVVPWNFGIVLCVEVEHRLVEPAEDRGSTFLRVRMCASK